MMRRLLISLCAFLMTLTVYADWPDRWDDCSPRSVSFGRAETFTAEESFELASAGELEVVASENGGIRVRGWNGSSYRVTVCKAVGAWNAGEARELFNAIRVERGGGRLSADGPSDGDWLVHFIIEAPMGADLTLISRNGPLSARDFEGDLDLDVQNGPISLRNVSGKVVARADNGPISLSGGSGEISLRAQNGPLSIDLDGSGWNGLGLDGTTENGPLTVTLGSHFVSGLLIETEGHSPVKCDPEICDGAKTRWNDSGVQFVFGGATPVVKLSTENGPLTIRSR